MEPQQPYQGPDRRQSKSTYGGEERRKAPVMFEEPTGGAGVSAQEATGQQPGDTRRAYDDTH